MAKASVYLGTLIYEAWNRADHCASLLRCCGAGQPDGEQDIPDADTWRRLKDSAEFLASYLRDIERARDIECIAETLAKADDEERIYR